MWCQLDRTEMACDVEIDDIRAGESGRCLELIKHSVAELAANHYSPEQIDAWINQYPSSEVFASWRQRRKMLVAREGDTIVGFGQIQFDRNEIVGVHVLPSRIRRSIGSRLVSLLEQAATEIGIVEVVIQASLNAVAFYESCGYIPVKKIEFAFSNGVKAEALFMKKRLVGNGI